MSGPAQDQTSTEWASERTVRVLIRGRVQGVGFRAWVHHQAQLRGLAGWVRNRADGSVEALFRGPGHVVEAMLDVCRQGPSNALVERLELADGNEAPPVPPAGFDVLATV